MESIKPPPFPLIPTKNITTGQKHYNRLRSVRLALHIVAHELGHIILNTHNESKAEKKRMELMAPRHSPRPHLHVLQGRPALPVCYGLSYTSFSYANLKASSAELTSDSAITVSVDVTNTGGGPEMKSSSST
jgi:hypothetical protein